MQRVKDSCMRGVRPLQGLPRRRLSHTEVSSKEDLPREPLSYILCCAQLLSCVQLFVSPLDCSPPGSSVHGILQARILEWVAMLSSRGSSQPRIKPRSPTLQADSLLSGPPGKPCPCVIPGLNSMWFYLEENRQGGSTRKALVNSSKCTNLHSYPAWGTYL